MAKKDIEEHIREAMSEPTEIDAEDLEPPVCAWCSDELGPETEVVVWDIPELGDVDVVYRYRYCSEECKDNDRMSVLEGGDMHPHGEPERLSEDDRELLTDGGRVTDATRIEQKEDFEPPEELEDEYEQTIRQTVKILTDDEDPPQGFHISLHRGGGVGFTTGMSPELVSGVGPTQPAVEMLAQHLSTVHQQTQGMAVDELAQLTASLVEKWDQDDE